MPRFCGDALSSIEVHDGHHFSGNSGFINVYNPDEGFYKLQEAKQISKRVSAALLAVLMGLSLLPQTVLALDPDQLAGLAKLVKEKVTFEGKTIRLGADIYLLRYEETGKPWWDGIGITTSSTAVFKGTFDGCGHTIDQMLAGSGGTGGVVGQFGDGSIANSYNYGNVTLGEGLVCNNLGGVIGRDMKKSGSQVENVYYLDSSCAYASTSGAAFRRGGNPRKSVIY